MELGLALRSAGSGRAARVPQPGSAQAHTRPRCMCHLASGLFHYQEPRWEQTQQQPGNTVRAVWGTGPHGQAGKARGHKWDGCFSLAEGPTVSEMLTKAFNTMREGTRVQTRG